jgi:hypothetical protein
LDYLFIKLRGTNTEDLIKEIEEEEKHDLDVEPPVSSKEEAPVTP